MPAIKPLVYKWWLRLLLIITTWETCYHPALKELRVPGRKTWQSASWSTGAVHSMITQGQGSRGASLTWQCAVTGRQEREAAWAFLNEVLLKGPRILGCVSDAYPRQRWSTNLAGHNTKTQTWQPSPSVMESVLRPFETSLRNKN